MRVLVAYSSRYGATAGIAERIAKKLTEAGHQAEAKPVSAIESLAGYDAFVVGSGLYFGGWRQDALRFVRRNRALLASRPGWLFGSGPLGTSLKDEKGEDILKSTRPTQSAELEAILPNGHRIFFGALDPSRLGFRDRLIRSLPAGKKLLPEGDFRNWDEIEGWASEIAAKLPQAVGEHAPRP